MNLAGRELLLHMAGWPARWLGAGNEALLRLRHGLIETERQNRAILYCCWVARGAARVSSFRLNQMLLCQESHQ